VVSGQSYPNKPIRMVTSPIGGGGDFIARQVAQAISGPLGQPVIVENRPSGIILGEILSKAPADGYTLLVGSNSLWWGPLLQTTPYDVARDFSPITMTSRSPLLLVVHPSLPAKSVKELIALGKARAGELNYSTTAIGSSTHLAAELFKSMAGVNIVRISYAGGALPLNALLGGEVQMAFVSPPGGMPHVRSGRFRALAVTSAEPSILVPGVPTIASSGVPGYELIASDGILAPAGTPAAIISRLNQEIVRFLNMAETKERFFNAGVETAGNSPEQFAATMKADMTRLGKVIKDAGIKVE
jgi:tripartite-type tricarboxylate transporter receptor subunit TctC